MVREVAHKLVTVAAGEPIALVVLRTEAAALGVSIHHLAEVIGSVACEMA